MTDQGPTWEDLRAIRKAQLGHIDAGALSEAEQLFDNTFWKEAIARNRPPRKPKHEDRRILARLGLFSKVRKRPAKRLSFKEYWRKMPPAFMQGQPRAARRAAALGYYRQFKNAGKPRNG